MDFSNISQELARVQDLYTQKFEYKFNHLLDEPFMVLRLGNELKGQQVVDYVRLIKSLLNILGKSIVSNIVQSSTTRNKDNLKVIEEREIYKFFNNYGYIASLKGPRFYISEIRKLQETQQNHQAGSPEYQKYQKQIDQLDSEKQHIKKVVSLKLIEKFNINTVFVNMNEYLKNIQKFLPNQDAHHCICCAMIDKLILIQHKTTGNYYFIGSTCEKQWNHLKQEAPERLDDLKLQVLYSALNEQDKICFCCGKNYMNNSKKDPYQIPIHRHCRSKINQKMGHKFVMFKETPQEKLYQIIEDLMIQSPSDGQKMFAHYLVYQKLMKYEQINTNLRAFINHIKKCK